MIKLNQCPICDCKKNKPEIACNDYLISNQNFSICSCSRCGFMFTSPRPTDGELGKFYQSNDYVSHSESKKGIINKLFIYARKYTLNSKLKLIKSLTEKKNILDVGCGAGSFLDFFKQNGFNVTGMEPSLFAREKAKKEYGLDILPIEEMHNSDCSQHDIITLWHVLEHVSDLNGYFKRFAEMLHKDGVLIIALPNRNSYDAQKYNAYWAAYDVPRHLWHFNKQDIETLGEKHGFVLAEIFPMKLDAFYISMLSEKYIHGKNKLVKAFFAGLKSNCYARKHNNEYSSLVYAFKLK